MLSEKNIKFLGVVIPGLVAAAGVVVSLWNLAETRQLESRRPFLEKQLDLCFDAAQATARLASGDETVRDAATLRFWELYWGELGLVENREVEQAMMAFRSGLEAGAIGNDLGRLSLRVAHSCRRLILKGWGVDLQDLKRG